MHAVAISLQNKQKSGPPAQTVRKDRIRGGPERDRTAGLCVANAALSQLSYRPQDRTKTCDIDIIPRFDDTVQ